MNNPFKASFDVEGVIVNVPAMAKKIKVVKLDKGSLDKMQSNLTDFNPIRLVINFALVDESAPNDFLSAFEAPITLQITYTSEDQQAADRRGKPLSLGFWDGQKWVRFTKAKHNFDLKSDPNPAKGGVGTVTITKWGDPPIGWGS